MNMTPLKLEIALHYHCHSNDYRDGNFDAPAVREALAEFDAEGLLKPGTPTRYKPTARLHAFVELLCLTPLPVQAWIDPKQGAQNLWPYAP